ncbi:MAG TPA: hypothetical protein VM760_01745 [Sphingomicrobium sp.]|nr:hypothetical protein [Sphingomicrobium sp.]
MHRRSIAYLAALSVVPLLGGCVQATRHSNLMVFGTNTSFGLKVGTAPNQVPSVVVGYDRQEAVLMPLLANTVDLQNAAAKQNLLSPCPVSPSGVPVQNHPCLFAARRGDAVDAYSVLASFGANFEGGNSATNATAKGGLAQYFSTGMAAQILALTGGASVVAVGKAAEKSAETAPDTAAAAVTLFGEPYTPPDAARRAQIDSVQKQYGEFKQAFLSRLISLPDDGYKGNITGFENRHVLGTELSEQCPTKLACIRYFDSNDVWGSYFNLDGAKRAAMIADAGTF